jgi:Uncharacterized protein conserved in bacteria
MFTSEAPGSLRGMAIEDAPRFRFEHIAQFRAWLDAHHETATGIRLEIAKKGSPIRTHTVEESLDAALEYGWIDGRRKSIDDDVFEQYYTPRGPKSTWSVKNVEAVERKIAAGEMKPRGMAEVEKAKADGRWERAYAGSKDAEPHPEFLAALAENPAAQATYATLSAQNRFAIYFRLHQAKKPETLTRNVQKFIDMLARGETLY